MDWYSQPLHYTAGHAAVAEHDDVAAGDTDDSLEVEVNAAAGEGTEGTHS